MRTPSVLYCACFGVMLAGCAGSVPPSRLELPARALMGAPEPLPDVKPGDDVVKSHAALRRSYATEIDRFARLQRYVRTITKR